VLFSAQAHSGYIELDPESSSESQTYSFEQTGDFLFFMPSSLELNTSPDALASLTLLQFNQPASPAQPANQLQLNAAVPEGTISTESMNAAGPNRELAIEIERHSNRANADADADLRRAPEGPYDPTAYMDQYVYGAITDYVQQSNLDIDPIHRTYTAVTTAIQKVDPYIPQPLRQRQGFKTEKAEIHIAPFEATLPGRVLIWLTDPDNFTSIIFSLIIGLAGFVVLNLLLQRISKKSRRRAR